MMEYVVGGVIMAGGSLFAAFNGLMSARDDARREHEERQFAALRASQHTQSEEARRVA